MAAQAASTAGRGSGPWLSNCFLIMIQDAAARSLFARHAAGIQAAVAVWRLALSLGLTPNPCKSASLHIAWSWSWSCRSFLPVSTTSLRAISHFPSPSPCCMSLDPPVRLFAEQYTCTLSPLQSMPAESTVADAPIFAPIFSDYAPHPHVTPPCESSTCALSVSSPPQSMVGCRHVD